MVNGDIKIFSGMANNPLAAEIADLLGTGLGDVSIQEAPDSETLVMVNESVRGCDVYVVQPTSAPVNDNLMHLLLIIDALRRASAKRITAVIPYFGYSRQERMAHGREPISAKVVADMLQSVGVDRIILTDIHAPAMQGFFNIPLETLSAVPLIIDYLKQRDLSDSVIVAPDVGRAKLAEQICGALGSSPRLDSQSARICHHVPHRWHDRRPERQVPYHHRRHHYHRRHHRRDRARGHQCRSKTSIVLGGGTRAACRLRTGSVESGLHQ